MAALRSTHATLAKRLAALTAASALVLAVGQSAPPAHEHAALAAPAAQATATTASTYTKNWDTFAISDPLPQASDASLEIFVHTRNLLAGLGPMVIEHGPHCEAPPATHMSSDPMSFSQAVFLCSAANPHLMTAINSGDYGVIYLTPAALADFSGGEAVVRFDVSTLRTSARDWIDLWVTPLDDAMPGPLDSQFPDLQGPPRRGLHSRMDPFYGSVFRSERFDNHAITSIGGGWPPLESVLTSTSASRRDTFEARITRTSFRLSIQQAGTTTWTVLSDGTFPALDWSKGVIQFGHHSYNPTKDCEPGAV